MANIGLIIMHIVSNSIDKRLLKFICIYINAINLFQYITGSAQPKLNQDIYEQNTYTHSTKGRTRKNS